MRDRLEELLMECFDIDEDGYYCLNERQKDDIVQEIADHLIKNGVTMQRWIPVSERLPTVDDAAEGRVWAILKGERPDMWSYISVRIHSEDFVYWMSIPKTPKE